MALNLVLPLKIYISSNSYSIYLHNSVSSELFYVADRYYLWN